MVGLLGEAWQVSGLSGEEELTLSPSLVGGEGFSGMDHLGRQKREPRRAMPAEQDAARSALLSFPGTSKLPASNPGLIRTQMTSTKRCLSIPAVIRCVYIHVHKTIPVDACACVYVCVSQRHLFFFF